MSSQASYKLFCQTLTLSQFLPAPIVWVWAQQNKGLLIMFKFITPQMSNVSFFLSHFAPYTYLKLPRYPWQTPPTCLVWLPSSLHWIDPSLAQREGKLCNKSRLMDREKEKEVILKEGNFRSWSKFEHRMPSWRQQGSEEAQTKIWALV